MNEDDLSRYFRELQQHYPNSTEADLQMVGDSVKGLSYEQGVRVLKAIRMTEKLAYRPTIPKFVAEARSVRDAARPAPMTHYHREVVRWIRNNSQSRGEMVGADDVRCIEIHFKCCWEKVQIECTDENGIQSMRRLILGHCRMALIQLDGWNETDATEFARTVVGLNPGEQIPRPSIFRQMPQPNTSFQQIKQLSIAEHSKSDAELVEENDTVPTA